MLCRRWLFTFRFFTGVFLSAVCAFFFFAVYGVDPESVEDYVDDACDYDGVKGCTYIEGYQDVVKMFGKPCHG